MNEETKCLCGSKTGKHKVLCPAFSLEVKVPWQVDRAIDVIQKRFPGLLPEAEIEKVTPPASSEGGTEGEGTEGG